MLFRSIAVIVNNVACWTIIVVMYIIITLKNGALDVDCHRMMMSRTMMNSIVHHHPMAVNNKSTIFQGDNDIHDNDDSPTSNDVDNDSNC